MEKSILKVFKNCQATTATHSQLVTKLINIYLKSDFKKFCDYFIYLMKFNLIHGEKIPAVERTLMFISNFSTSVKSEGKEEEAPVANNDDDEDVDIDPFLVFVFEFLLENHDAVSKSVRYRVCQLINQILNYMGEQASIDDQLYTKIYDTMLQRLMDRCHNVRVQAILALSRLQDPRNKECPVIKAYLFHLSMDPNPEVRKAVLSNIAITFQTLPDILERRRDIRDTVRRQAYIILAQKVHIRSFTIAQRIMIISEGLKDRSPFVQQALKKNILQAWLRMVDGNVLELLKCLDVEASKESAELALKHIFENVPYDTLLENFNFLDEKNLIPHEKLTPESALYWICLAKHLKAEKAEEHLEKILPDLKIFCDSIREYVQKESPDDEDPQETAVLMMQKDFVCQQLLSMTIFFDMADVVGRKSLCTLVRLLFITLSVSEATIKTLSEVFIHLYPPAERVNELAEIISDIRDPPEADTNVSSVAQTTELFDSPKVTKISEDDQRKIKLKLAQISVKMNQNREELEECVRSLNLEKAFSLKENLKKLEEEKAKLLEEGIAIITPQATPVVPSSQTRMPEDDEEVKLRNDPETLSRCLLILCEFLVSPDVTVFGSILRSLHDNLILPCLKSEYEGVRRLAVRGLNLCCLLSKELAKQYLLLLIQISKMDVDEIQSEALKGVFDIWLLYGLDEFNSAAEDVSEIEELIKAKGDGNDDDFDGLEDDQTHTVRNMIPLFTKMLETGNNEARTLTAHGLCKMLMVSQVNSTKLLSNLLLLYYNPENEVDNMLRHMLGVFFPLYASLGGLNQEILGKSLIPTLHIIFNAPARSPLSDIDLDDLVNFLVSLTSPSIVSTNTKATSNAHNSLVFSLCAEILAFPDREYTRSLVRNLNHLSLTQTDYTKLKQISCLMNKIIEKITDKLTLNSAEKFRQFVQNLLLSAPKDEDIKNETLGETLNETVQNVTSADLTSETIQNVSQQQRRKRILYSSQTDVELISDLDSENDRSPSKIKRLDQHSSVGDTTAISDSMDLGTTSIRETDDEEEIQEEEKEIRDLKELELSIDNETTQIEETDDDNSMKQDEDEVTIRELEITTKEDAPKSANQSSSDLFESLEERIAVPEDKTRKPSSINESEDEGSQETHSRDTSCSSFVTASPPRKSPRMQGAQLRSGRKKPEVSRTRSSKIINKIVATPSSSSSSSFYSTRNSRETPKVSLPKSKRGKSSQEESSDEEEEDEEKVVLDRSLRVQIKKLIVNKNKQSKRKTPRKSEREETTEDDEEEKVVLNRSLRVKVNKLNSNKKQSTKTPSRKFVDETGSKVTRLSKSDQSSNRNRKSVDSSTRPTRSSKSSSVTTEEESRAMRTRFSSLTVNETPTSSSSSPSGATRSRAKPNPEDRRRSASTDKKSASLTRKMRPKPAVTDTPSGSSDSLSVGPRASRPKAVSKLLETSLSSSRTTRSSLSTSLRDSSSPVGSSPASVASSSRSRRMK